MVGRTKQKRAECLGHSDRAEDVDVQDVAKALGVNLEERRTGDDTGLDHQRKVCPPSCGLQKGTERVLTLLMRTSSLPSVWAMYAAAASIVSCLTTSSAKSYHSVSLNA